MALADRRSRENSPTGKCMANRAPQSRETLAYVRTGHTSPQPYSSYPGKGALNSRDPKSFRFGKDSL